MTASTPQDRPTGTDFLQRLIRHAVAAPEVRAVATGNPPGLPVGDRFAELYLYLVAPALAGLLGQWMSLLGEGARGDGSGKTAGSGGPADPAYSGPVEAVAGPGRDLAAEAADFWHSLYQSLAAIGRERPFSAHGHLERCRQRLLSLYRLALAPGGQGEGFIGIESFDGAAALDGLTEWLVAPLQTRSQWRSAHRTAAAYENLMLPLSRRLGFAYPWAMRNLAFGRLDEVRPYPQPTAGAAPGQRPPAPAGEAHEPTTERVPARFRIKSRSDS